MFTLVIPIDKAVSPFAKNVITLLAVPQEQVPTKIPPAVSEASNLKA